MKIEDDHELDIFPLNKIVLHIISIKKSTYYDQIHLYGTAVKYKTILKNST